MIITVPSLYILEMAMFVRHDPDLQLVLSGLSNVFIETDEARSRVP